MKHACALLMLLSLVVIAKAQSEAQRILGSFVYKNHAYNYEFSKEGVNSFSFRITSVAATSSPKKQENDSTTEADVANDQGSDSVPTYIFSEFNKSVFETIFVGQMTLVFHVDSSALLRDKSSEVFFSIQARLDFIDDEPVTAYFILKKDSINSFLKSNTSSFYEGELSRWRAKHTVKRVNIETEDGAIKNIIVHLVKPKEKQSTSQSPRAFLEFKNQSPISISGKFDSEKFADINLYCFNCAGISGLSRYVKLSDLLILDVVLENDKEDYSPSNRTISITPTNPIQELKKEKRSRILEIASFTDLSGLDQDQPNGLIQIEAKRRININTKSHLLFGARKNEDIVSQVDISDIDSVYTPDPHGKRQARSTYTLVLKPSKSTLKKDTTPDTLKLTIKNKKFRSPYFTLFTSLEPKLLFSKLEENNRVLDSSSFESDTLISPLKLYQYQVWSFGATLNVFKLSFPQVKFSWNVLNVGAYFFRTKVGTQSDSVNQSVPLNSSYLLLNTNVMFRPDNRWGQV
jgi:hypothetical protein